MEVRFLPRTHFTLWAVSSMAERSVCIRQMRVRFLYGPPLAYRVVQRIQTAPLRTEKWGFDSLHDNHFARVVTINNVSMHDEKMKTCSKCGCEKPLSKFNVADKTVGRVSSYCKTCNIEYKKAYYETNKQRLLVKNRNYRKHRRTEAVDYLSKYLSEKACEICGINDIRVLEFDHLNPADKSGTVSTMIKNVCSLDEIKSEVSKCRVLCCNCHRIHTGEQNGSWRNRLFKSLPL